MQALVAIASPSDVDRYQLAIVNSDVELMTAHIGLGDIPDDRLAQKGRVTLKNIVARFAMVMTSSIWWHTVCWSTASQNYC